MKFIQGINQDVQPIDQPENTYRSATNMLLSKKLGTIANERGTEEIVPNIDMDVLCVLPVENKAVLFGKDGANNSIIKLFDSESETIDQIISNEDLDFGNELQAVYERDYKGDLLVYWVDEKNPPRFINLNNPETGDLSKLNLYPHIDAVPSIENITVNDTGGNLKTGTYIFAIKYIDRDNTPTNYISFSLPVHINFDNSGKGSSIQGSNSNIPTSKSISFDIKNISQNYQSLVVTAIPTYDGVIDSLQRLPEFTINNVETEFTYSGTESFKLEALENVQIDNASYANAKAITIHDNQLYLGNLENDEDIGYQKYANKIEVVPAIREIPGFGILDRDPNSNDTHTTSYDLGDSYNWLNNHNKYRGYKREEVYAFYISWILKNGKETRAYHIPGRESFMVNQQAKGSIVFHQPPSATIIPAETQELTVGGSIGIDGDFLTVSYDFETDDIFLPGDSDTPEQIVQTIYDFFESVVIESPIKENLSIEITGAGTFKFIDERGSSANTNIVEMSLQNNSLSSIFSGQNLDGEATMAGGDVDAGSEPDFQISFDSIATPNYSILIEPSGFTFTSETIAEKVKDDLNADVTFNTHYTASRVFNRVDIEANAFGPDYNSTTIEVNPLSGNVVTSSSAISGGIDNEDMKDEFAEWGVSGKRYHFFSNDAVGEMGYWENTNEVYPDNEHWDYGDEGEFGANSLRGEPVRHHKFPSIIGEPLTSFSEDRYRYRVLGFKLENVEIPEALKDKVVGYKIYRAHRSIENKTILDQSYIHSANIQNGILRPSFSTGTSVDDIFYAHPFKNIIDEESLSSLSHIKAVSYFDTDRNGKTYGSTPVTAAYAQTRVNNKPGEELNIEDSDRIRAILGSARVPFVPEDQITSLVSQGIGHSVNNKGGETKIIFKVNNEFDQLVSKRNRNEISQTSILADMCLRKDNLYNSFDKQILAETGYTHYDLDNLNSDEIFGGDCFINVQNYKVTGISTNILFSNLISGVVESEYNIALRKSGDMPWEIFYPASPAITASAVSWRDGTPLLDDSNFNHLQSDNFFAYNQDASYNTTIKNPQIFPKRDVLLDRYPWRITRSEQSDEEALNKLRIFRQDNFTDLPKNRGELIKLSVFNNNIIPHMRRGILRTKGREQLQTDGVTAYIGIGDIFSIKPDDYIFTENGFGGIKSPHDSINTPFGYLFVDRDGRRVFNLTNEGLNEISNTGLRDFFYENIPEKEIRLGFNSQYRRILISLGNEHTISYYPEFSFFGSFHTYSPDIFFDIYDKFYGIKNNSIFEHNSGDFGVFYGDVKEKASIVFVDNRSPETSKLVRSVQFNTEVYENGSEIVNETFTKFKVMNSYQDTVDYKDIVPFVFDQEIDYLNQIEARRTKRLWFVNGFRDETNVPQGTSQKERWLYQRRFEDKYTIVELVYDNERQIYLYDAEVNYKFSIR